MPLHPDQAVESEPADRVAINAEALRLAAAEAAFEMVIGLNEAAFEPVMAFLHLLERPEDIEAATQYPKDGRPLVLRLTVRDPSEGFSVWDHG